MIEIRPARREDAEAVAVIYNHGSAERQATFETRPRRPSRVFTTNQASLSLHRRAGFTEVGIQCRHGRLDGEGKDTVLVEKLLGEAARGG